MGNLYANVVFKIAYKFAEEFTFGLLGVLDMNGLAHSNVHGSCWGTSCSAWALKAFETNAAVGLATAMLESSRVRV